MVGLVNRCEQIQRTSFPQRKDEPPVQIMSDSAQDLYQEVLEALPYGEIVASVRNENSIGSGWGARDRPTKELRYPTLILTNPRDRIVNGPMFPLEKAIPRAVLGTLSDELDASALTFYDPKAISFSDDGKTMPSNYGYRIRHLENIDQIQLVIDQFKKDPLTRRAVIHIHTVSDSERKYDPCIDSLHFLIRNGALECHSFWRSENALTLLPINIFEFTLLQELIASELRIPLGKYVHTITSLHYYLDDQDKLKSALVSTRKPKTMDPMPYGSLRLVAILREYERKLRLQQGEVDMDEFQELPPYWQDFARIIACAIAKRINGSVSQPIDPWRISS